MREIVRKARNRRCFFCSSRHKDTDMCNYGVESELPFHQHAKPGVRSYRVWVCTDCIRAYDRAGLMENLPNIIVRKCRRIAELG